MEPPVGPVDDTARPSATAPGDETPAETRPADTESAAMPGGGRYRLLREIGRGGMGRVWEADDRALRRRVAVKEVLLPEGLASEERRRLVERATREARTAARLEHESIVVVHDVFVHDDRPWIVMELVDGVTLREAAPVPPAEAARVGAAVLAALRAAHAAGVLHRDVSMGNVLLAEDGRVVLTDFGIAVMDGDTALTRTGTVVGNPGHIAPERLGGGPVDGRSDLFSLGVTLYAAVEGRGPFARSGDAATLAATLTEPPPRPRRAGPLRPVLAALLRKDPAERPDPAALDRTLRRIAAGRPRRPRLKLRGRLLPETAWLAAMAVAAGVFLLPDAVTGPRGPGAYGADVRPCPMALAEFGFGAADTAASGVHSCSGDRYGLRWYEGYRGEHGAPGALRFSSVRAAHRWLRFLNGFDVEHEQRYPFTYQEESATLSGFASRLAARRPRPLEGVGDDAFVREVRTETSAADSGGGLHLLEVTFRDSNVVLSVRTEVSESDDPAAVRAGLTATAEQVVAVLRATGR
ncbi:serine/threonine-protein kinase [Actinomadura sp. 7K534]|uniref:serine/threonine-protein kinase n=1 Tax=Actinomadura sp. 7K534 TaxID=2530366 RepID=UPI001A9FFFBD|nr:serine/threonine-protein kinase [Actinomadura sp. 7K534]